MTTNSIDRANSTIGTLHPLPPEGRLGERSVTPGRVDNDLHSCISEETILSIGAVTARSGSAASESVVELEAVPADMGSTNVRYSANITWDGVKYFIWQDLPAGSDRQWKELVEEYKRILTTITAQKHPHIRAGMNRLDLVAEEEGIRAANPDRPSPSTAAASSPDEILFKETKTLAQNIRKHTSLGHSEAEHIAPARSVNYQSNLCYMHALFHLFTECPVMKNHTARKDWSYFLQFAQRYKGRQEDIAEAAEQLLSSEDFRSLHAIKRQNDGTGEDLLPPILHIDVPEGLSRKEISIGDLLTRNSNSLNERFVSDSPSVLMLHLDRAKTDHVNRLPVTLGHFVMLPTEYVDDLQSPDPLPIEYDLQGYAVHFGDTPKSGHYVVYFKTVDEAGETHYWRGTDAEIAEITGPTAAQEFLATANQTAANGCANFLLYTKSDPTRPT